MGPVLHALGRSEEGTRAAERALILFERIFGAQHPSVTGTLMELGEMYLDVHRPQDAVKCLERALKHASTDTSAPELPELQFNLAKALWDSGTSRSRAAEQARAARDLFKEQRSPRAEEVNVWLARHRPH